ncbi:hypothetical protein ILUMI_12367 [Ignelater luminosus]|uniref:Major facilitator superfamily (MFS) profile domain-containing protein n=1 Tax=Ignelater luminosus TaxID=2038154 RepID=A0A8K0CYQ5_IGNLU|nr:hypothetical protein ILUMI_12367 [Ignelater luminosus]
MDTKHSNNGLFTEQKLKRRRLRVGDSDFRPPDGGWGWLVVLACGFSNLSTFPMFQQFGLVFREKFETLGITNAETTTIINLNSAFNACVGLLNGPVFRKYSYRKVALFGGTLVATSLFISTFCQSFWTYLIFYAICYGSGIGITQSANALALNTYFKNKRRIATGLSWSTTALGPIVWPYIITALTGEYGMEGTLMIFSAFAGHAVMCSLLLQPVHWHTEFREVENGIPLIQVDKDAESGYFEDKTSRSRSIFSSQYLYNEDDPIHTGYEITDPGTPRMVGANDGWYSQNRSLAASRMSLVSNKTATAGSKITSTQHSRAVSRKPSYTNLLETKSKKSSTLNLSHEGKERKRKPSYNKAKIVESVCEDCPLEKAPQDLKEEEKLLISKKPSQPVIVYPNEKEVLKTAAQKLAEYKQIKDIEKEKIRISEIAAKEQTKESAEKKYSLWQKIVIFFDLDLLKDSIYLNIMLGITIANFAELNFSILTPFVLKEFNFEKYQIATFMSLLGATDILVRFFIPFLADKIGWSNRTFFLAGVLGMAFGRIILVHTQVFSVSLGVAVMIGFGKGLRTIFMALVIPSHVSLERLPAASGLHLATSGILFLILGPVVGWVRDAVDNYVVTLHLLNIMTYITTVAWTVEHFMRNRKKEEKDKIMNKL